MILVDPAEKQVRLSRTALLLVIAFTVLQALLGCAPADPSDIGLDVSIPPQAPSKTSAVVDQGPLSAQQVGNAVVVQSEGKSDRLIANAELISSSSRYVAYREGDLTTLEDEESEIVESCVKCSIEVTESFAVVVEETRKVLRAYNRRFGLIFMDTISNEAFQGLEVNVHDYFLSVQTNTESYLFHERRNQLAKCRGSTCESGADIFFGYISDTNSDQIQFFDKLGRPLHQLKNENLQLSFNGSLLVATNSMRVLVAHSDRGVVFNATGSAEVRSVGSGFEIRTAAGTFEVRDDGSFRRVP